MIVVENLPFALVDVFAEQPLAGNGLAVFSLERELPAALMLRIAQEMRQYETIFLRPGAGARCFAARIFTTEEELAFAGHPVIGAAAWLHASVFAECAAVDLCLELAAREVPVTCRQADGRWTATMNQGTVHFQPPLAAEVRCEIAAALTLELADLHPELPLQVVSTGLPYLIVPLRRGLERARIGTTDFGAVLARLGAAFVYVLDVEAREGRSWDNAGRVEDIATGSAVGPAAAYLVAQGYASPGVTLPFAQGRFVGRPSHLRACVEAGIDDAWRVAVSGEVCLVGDGQLRVPRAWCEGAAGC